MHRLGARCHYGSGLGHSPHYTAGRATTSHNYRYGYGSHRSKNECFCLIF